MWGWSETPDLPPDLHICSRLPRKVSNQIPVERITTKPMAFCRVLLACIKYLSRNPCPRCLIEKEHIPSTGTRGDSQRRSHLRVDNNLLQNAISKAREWIFEKGLGISAKWIKDTLGSQSQMPNRVRNELNCSRCTAPITYAMSL